MSFKILLLLVALFAVKINAQNLTCMAPDKIDSKANSVSLLLKSTSALIKSVRVIAEKTGKTSKQEIKQNVTYAINLKVERDVNNFNAFGYDNNDRPIPNEICSVTVERDDPSQEDATVSTTALANKFTDKNEPPKKDNGEDNGEDVGQDDNGKNNGEKVAPKKAPEVEPLTQSKNFRAVVGLEQIGASSATSKQQPFFDLFFNTPISSQKRKLQLSVWGNIRFSTTPVQGINSLSSVSLPTTFATNFVQTDSTSKVNDLVQAFDFLTGLELQLFKSKVKHTSLLPGISSVSLILSGGAVSPLTADKGATYYKIPRVNNDADIDPRFKELFPNVTTQKNVAFVSPERDRFFRQYFAGFRIKTNYLMDKSSKVEREDLVSGMFDITFGQNEAMTTKLRGLILRLDGSMPIPLFGNNFLYVFGSTQMRMGRNLEKPLPSIFLEPVSPIALSSADTFVVSATQNPALRANRDIFRIGVGVDLLKLFKSDKSTDTPSKPLN